MHCAEPGCLIACPAPGAIVQYTNGIVDFQQDQCIGCGYCISGCPFDVRSSTRRRSRVYKCTLCVDRVSVGLQPACVKACPTSCLQFGTKDAMLETANTRVAQLKANGFAQAAVYDPPGVGGTGVVTVLAFGDRPELYGLPRDPDCAAGGAGCGRGRSSGSATWRCSVASRWPPRTSCGTDGSTSRRVHRSRVRAASNAGEHP